MENDRKNINIQIGKRLREARTNMNIDKSEFARVLDVTEEHYRKLEVGATGLSADKILILYHTLKIIMVFLSVYIIIIASINL